MTRTATWGLLVLAACGTKGDPPGDTDTVTDSDTDVTADTQVTHETGDTGDTEVLDTVVIDTDGTHVVLHGRLRCAPTEEDTDGYPASPGFAKITLVQPWYCPPLSGCNENTSLEVLAEAAVDSDGIFDLDFQTGSYTVEELFLYTNNDIGVCGNGYQFTQAPLTDYHDWTDILIDVYSIFY